MSDQTSDMPMSRAERKPGAEFWVYYTGIFAVSLPVAVGFWAYGIASGKPGKGPFARAHAKAWEITPQIFASR